MDVESGVSPGKHVFDNGVVDFAIFFQHLQNFALEGLFEVLGVESWNAGEGAVGKKATVGDDGVQARIVIGKISPCMYGKASSGDRAVAGNCGFQKGAHCVPRAFARLAEQGAVVHETNPEALGYAKYLVPAGDFFQTVGQQPFAVFDDALLAARGAKVAALARKRQEIFMAAIVASNTGEAASQVAAVQIAIDRVRYIRSPESV